MCCELWLLAVGLKFSGAHWEALGEIEALSPELHPVRLPANAQVVLSGTVCLKCLAHK